MPVKPKRILFLIPYPLKESPSQRFRFEQYFPLLTEQGFQFEIQSFLSLKNWKLFFVPGKLLKKVSVLSVGFLKRFSLLIKVKHFDFIFIHRETTPLGPPVYEWILTKLFQKKIIYDFDDAIWLTDRTDETLLLRLLKWRKKVATICRWSYKVSCGNDYLASFAKQYNSNVVVNPTTVDTTTHHNPALFPLDRQERQGIVIGWTGSHSTLKYLQDSVPILSQIECTFPNVKFTVIADRKPELRLKNLHFIPWNPETEIRDLMNLDIGIMPLPDDKWSQGKCGFKALQYMALKIPAIASRVGVNDQIIDDGVNGYLCTTGEEWLSALTKLIENQSMRLQMGARGRDKVINRYSVTSNSSLYLNLFE